MVGERTARAMLDTIAVDRKKVEAMSTTYDYECTLSRAQRRARVDHEHHDIIDLERQRRLQLEQLDGIAARYDTTPH